MVDEQLERIIRTMDDVTKDKQARRARPEEETRRAERENAVKRVRETW